MDNLSPARASILLRQKEERTSRLPSVAAPIPNDPIHLSGGPPKTGWLPVGLVDDFVRIQWMLSFGFSGWIASEYAFMKYPGWRDTCPAPPPLPIESIWSIRPVA